MMPVDPRPKLPPMSTMPNAEYVVIAKDQDGVRPLPALMIRARDQERPDAIVVRWALTDAERKLIVDGGDFWLMVETYGQPLQPMRAAARPEDLIE